MVSSNSENEGYVYILVPYGGFYYKHKVLRKITLTLSWTLNLICEFGSWTVFTADHHNQNALLLRFLVSNNSCAISIITKLKCARLKILFSWGQ